MFENIGKFASRFRIPIVVFWLALTLVSVFFTPSLSDAIVSDWGMYLPEGEPSAVAAEVAAEYFPDQSSSAQAVLVLETEGSSIRDAANMAFLSDLTAWLEGDQAPAVIGPVLSPVQEELAGRFISEDGRVAMLYVALQGAVDDKAVLEAQDLMRARLDQAPSGTRGYVTGSVAILNDYLNGALESVDRTTVITIILVVVILLAIYRSLLSPMVPLLTIGVAFLVSRGLVGWFSRYGWSVSNFTELFMIVLLFGAGTDYCLFLVSRFREYVASDLPGPLAAQKTVGRVGETITSSAGTVIVGMVAISFAQMGLFASTGPSCAIAIVVGLIAGLTLTPALLSLLGRWAFWPGGAKAARHAGFWGKLARFVTTRPWLPLGLAIAVLVPLAIYGGGQPRNFDLMSDLPAGTPSRAGFAVLSEGFGAGEMQPLDVVATEIPHARTPEGLAYIDALTTKLLAVEGVADVRSLTLPGGKEARELADQLRVDSQLELMLGSFDELADPDALAELDPDEALTALEVLGAYIDELALAFPDVAAGTEFATTRDSLESLEDSVSASVGRLLVSNQLAEAARGLTAGFAGQDLTSALSAGGLEAAADQISGLRSYLLSLADAYPEVGQLPGYGDALAALDGLGVTMSSIQESLLVSAQIDLLADGLAKMSGSLTAPGVIAELAATSDQSASLALLDDYLEALAAAHPGLAAEPSFESALEHLAAASLAVDELRELRLVSGQLAMIAEQMDDTAQTLSTNPLALITQPGEPQPAEQMAGLGQYLAELGSAYPSLASAPEYEVAVATTGEMATSLEKLDISHMSDLVTQMIQATETLSAAFEGLSAMASTTLPEAIFLPEGDSAAVVAIMPALTGLTDELAAAQEDLTVAAQAVRQDLPGATFVPEPELLEAMAQVPGILPGGSPADLESLAASHFVDLALALSQLSTAAKAALPEATFVPPGELLALLGESDAGALLSNVGELRAGLEALSDQFANRDDGFLIPQALLGLESGGDTVEQAAGIDQLLNTYTTASGEATRLQVVLADDPFSPAAMETVARLRSELEHSSVAYISGTSAVSLDLKDVMDRDYFRAMGLVIGGVFVVLLFLLRSLVAPVYLMGTILLSYGATMGITRLVFEGILGQGLAWFAPFLIFVVLVALGMDYNIFLMARVKEEVAGNGTRAGIERAVERTGGIITSAGIIMAGTFAAMMSSSLLGLVQIAFSVTVGILLDTFVIRTTLVPAIAVLLDKWNWWPGTGPTAP